MREGSVAAGLNDEAQWESLDDLITAMAAKLPAFGTIPAVAPSHSAVGRSLANRTGTAAALRCSPASACTNPSHLRIPTPPSLSRWSPVREAAPSSLIPFFWAPGWNSIQAVNKFQSEVGGPLRGGDPGVRLIEQSQESGWQYFSAIPSQFKARPGEWLLVPIFHIFGSEELSRHAQGIAQLLARPYVALNPVEASLLGANSWRADQGSC